MEIAKSTSQLDNSNSEVLIINQGKIINRKFYLDQKSSLYKCLERRTLIGVDVGTVFSCDEEDESLNVNGFPKPDYLTKTFYLLLADTGNGEPMIARITPLFESVSKRKTLINVGSIEKICPYVFFGVDISTIQIVRRDVFIKLTNQYNVVGHLNNEQLKVIRSHLSKLFKMPSITNDAAQNYKTLN